MRLSRMRESGIIPWQDVPALYVLGRYSPGQLSSPSDLIPFVAPDAPRFRHWTTCAFGRHEAAAVTAGALLGGHVRVGFENNLQLPDGATAASNADLVGVTAEILRRCGVRLLTAQELRDGWAALR